MHDITDLFYIRNHTQDLLSVAGLAAFVLIIVAVVINAVIILPRKFVKHCRERGFTILDKKNAKNFFPQDFSIFFERKGDGFFSWRRIEWFRWVALNQASREMYFINLGHGSSQRRGYLYVSGVALKINVDAPYVKICHEASGWSLFEYLYKPYVEVPGSKVPGSKYTVFTAAQDVNVFFDFVTAYAQMMEKAKLNAEVSEKFMIFYKFTDEDRPGDFMDNVMPAAEALAEIFEWKKQ